MATEVPEVEYALRRVQIYADNLLKMEIMIWSEGDDQAIGLACKAAREVLRGLPKRPHNMQRYSIGLQTVNLGDQNKPDEDYNGVADPLQSTH